MTAIERAIKRIEEIRIRKGSEDPRIDFWLVEKILKEELARKKRSPCLTCKKYCEGDSWVSPYCTLDDNILDNGLIDNEDCCRHNKGIDDLYEEGEPQKIIIRKGERNENTEGGAD